MHRRRASVLAAAVLLTTTVELTAGRTGLCEVETRESERQLVQLEIR